MQLNQILTVMEKRRALQAVISTNAPPRFYCDGAWNEGGTSPSDFALRQMVEESAPPHLRAQIASSSVSFDAPLNNLNYRVVLQKTRGIRVLVVTQLKANGSLSLPLPALDDEPNTPLQSSPLNASSASINPTMSAGASSRDTRSFAPANLSMGTALPNAGLASPNVASVAAPSPRAQAVSPPFAASAQTPPTMEQWHYARNGRQIGPIERSNIERLIRDGTISRETMVWREGMPEWQMAKLTDLSAFFDKMPPAQSYSTTADQDYVRTSGNDSGLDNAELPDELKGLNWGAALFIPLWLINHGKILRGVSYIVWSLVIQHYFSKWSYIYMAFYSVSLLLTGNDIAWKHRKWRDVEQFRETQHAWARMGVIVIVTVPIAFLLIFKIALSR